MKNTEPPKVSVIMSVYNGERYLRQSVDSVLHQTFEDFEFIIVNDGSIDKSAEILAGFEDSRIVLLKNPKNIGLPSSLNRALEVSRGEIIARHDADDTSEPNRFAEQVSYLERHPEIGVLGSYMAVIDEAGKLQYTYELPQSSGMIMWNFFFGRSIAHPTVMYRKRVIEETGPYDPTFKYTEDLELWTRLVGTTGFANLNRSLYLYKDRVDSISHTKQEEQLASIMVIRRRLARKILGRDVPLPVFEWLHQSQLPAPQLSTGQIREVLSLILELRQAMQEKGLILADESQEIHENMVERVMACADNSRRANEAAPGASLSKRMPRPLQLVAKAVSNPRRAAYVLQHQAKSLISGLGGGEAKKGADSFVIAVSPTSNEEHIKGITVIVLSYERMAALADLLRSLLRQDFGGIAFELIVCNNSARVNLRASRFAKVGNLLSKFPDVKIFNSSFNWRCRVRYGLATLAAYDTVMFIDDDITLIDRNFIRYMFDTFITLRPVDIISCWNTLWVEWTDDYLRQVSLSLETPQIAEITPTDTIGPGISMFSKRILLSPRLMEMSRDFPRADDMAFPLIASMEWGSWSYFVPSYSMLKMHDQGVVDSLNTRESHYEELYSQYRRLLEQGYQPVLARNDYSSQDLSSAARRAVGKLPIATFSWK